MATKNNKSSSSPGLAIVVFGISGAGKTTIGKLIAEALSCDFLDADDYHSLNNIEKMRSGIALSDADRLPWLEKLRDVLGSYLVRQKQVVLACSALKKSYRDILRDAAATTMTRNKVVFVYLKVSANVISDRVEARFEAGNHYMPPSLLTSQLAILEVGDKFEEDVVAVETSSQAQVAANDALHKLRSLIL